MPPIDASRPVSAPAPTATEPCPYCGEILDRLSATEQSGGTPRCRNCLAFLDPLSKQVTQGHMGPWCVRDETRPFYPGVAFDVLSVLVARGEVTSDTVIRGPGTGQFWMRAGRTPGVAHLLGVCHACQGDVNKSATANGSCPSCGARFPTFAERDRLGLVGAQPAQRLSAFASDDELRDGSTAPRAAPRPVVPPPPAGLTNVLTQASSLREGARSPLEISLSEEVVAERKKTLWLLMAIGLLLIVNLGIAVWALTSMKHS
ncbi:MAG: hypothetical protein JNL80_01675 [Phycisphaerae bacterium]|nr:hypothetical protein [Phycisphaerae bacterium]